MLQKKNSPVISFALLIALATASAPMALSLATSLKMESAIAQSAASPSNASPSFTLPTSVPKGTTVRVNGSSSMAAINQQLKQQFENQYPGTTINVEYADSTTALQALKDGRIDLAAIGRSLTPAERDQGLVAVPVTRSKIAIIVGPENPFNGSLTGTQFAQIFRGEVTDWSQVGGAAGPIRFIDRVETSDTRQAFKNYPVFEAAPFQAGPKTEVASEDSTEAVIKALGKDGIGYATANQLAKLKDSVRIVQMHKTLPDNPAYPFSQPLLYVYKANPAAGATSDATTDPNVASPNATPGTAGSTDTSGNLTAGTTAAIAAFLGFAAAPQGQQAIQTALNNEGTGVAVGAPGGPAPTATTSAAPAGGTAGTPSGAAIAPAANGGATATSGHGLDKLWWLLPLGLAGLLIAWLLKNRRPEESDESISAERNSAGTAPVANRGNVTIPPATPSETASGTVVDDPNLVTRTENVVSSDRVSISETPEANRIGGIDAPATRSTNAPTPPNTGANPGGLTAGAAGLAGAGAAAWAANRDRDPEAPPAVRAADSSEVGADVTTPDVNADVAPLETEAPSAYREPTIEPPVVEPIEPIERPTIEAIEPPVIEPIEPPIVEPIEPPTVTPPESAGFSNVGGAALGGAALGAASWMARSGAPADPAEGPADVTPPTEAASSVSPSIDDEPLEDEPLSSFDAIEEMDDLEAQLDFTDDEPDDIFFDDDTASAIDLENVSVDTPDVQSADAGNVGGLLGGAALGAATLGMAGLAANGKASENDSTPEPISTERNSAGTAQDQTTIEAAKFNVGQTDLSSEMLATVDEGLPELPAGYGDSRIVLMPRDPQWVYAYWDVPNEQREEVRRQGGQRLALRLYDVTDIDVNHQSPHSLQQFDCEELARDWYAPIPVSDRDYLMEIGYLTADSRWFMLARSAPIRVPPVYPSAWEKDQFATVNWDDDLRNKTILDLGSPTGQLGAIAANPIYDEMFGLAQGAESQRIAGSLFGSMQGAVSSFVMPAGMGRWALPTPSGMGVSGALTMSGIGFSGAVGQARPRKFWLVADAELIVYGATEPDAKVTIAGQEIELNPDGTFRFQMSFQDGLIDYPIFAVAADGEQNRSVHLKFNRETPSRQTNTKDEATDEWFR